MDRSYHIRVRHFLWLMDTVYHRVRYISILKEFRIINFIITHQNSALDWARRRLPLQCVSTVIVSSGVFSSTSAISENLRTLRTRLPSSVSWNWTLTLSSDCQRVWCREIPNNHNLIILDSRQYFVVEWHHLLPIELRRMDRRWIYGIPTWDGWFGQWPIGYWVDSRGEHWHYGASTMAVAVLKVLFLIFSILWIWSGENARWQPSIWTRYLHRPVHAPPQIQWLRVADQLPFRSSRTELPIKRVFSKCEIWNENLLFVPVQILLERWREVGSVVGNVEADLE